MKKNVNIIVPQYHSSYCIDDCGYCGFRNSNKIIPRNRLSDQEFEQELQLLIEWGYRTIEFVYASDRFFSAEKVAKRIKYAKNYSQKHNLELKIGLNSEPLAYKDYQLLHAAGLDFFVLWMETYSENKFAYWHGSKTPKSNYKYRYEAYERAIEAGLVNYGMGVLFGLHHWEDDVNALIEHAQQLSQKYQHKPYIIGIPRLKTAHSVTLEQSTPVSDSDFSQAISLYRQAFPNAMLFFNTRESFELNLKLCQDHDLFTIDCATYPAAFLNPQFIKEGISQFNTHYYDRNSIIQKLIHNNINPVFSW